MNVSSFILFRRTLDAEMKDATSHSLHLKYVKVRRRGIILEFEFIGNFSSSVFIEHCL